MLALGVIRLVDTTNYMGKVVTTTGTIVKVQPSSTGKTKCLIIGFTTQQRQTVEFRDEFCDSTYSDAMLNTPVSIIYEPANPGNARKNDFMSVWFVGIFLTLIGVAFAATGFAMIVGSHRWQPINRNRIRVKY